MEVFFISLFSKKQKWASFKIATSESWTFYSCSHLIIILNFDIQAAAKAAKKDAKMAKMLQEEELRILFNEGTSVFEKSKILLKVHSLFIAVHAVLLLQR